MTKLISRLTAPFYRTLTEFQTTGLTSVRTAPTPTASSSSAPAPEPLPNRWLISRMFCILTVVLAAVAVRQYFLPSPVQMNYLVAGTWVLVLWSLAQTFVKTALTVASPLSQVARARFRYDYNQVLVAPPFLYRAVAGPGYRLSRFILTGVGGALAAFLVTEGYIFPGLALALVTVLNSVSERTAVQATLRRLEEIGHRALTVVEGPQELETGLSAIPGCVCANLETREALGVQPGDEVRVTYEESGKYIVRPVVRVTRNVKGINDVIYLHPHDMQELEVPMPPARSKVTVEKEGFSRRTPAFATA